MNNSKRTCLLQAGLQTFLKAYNFAKRLKTLKGLTPYEKVIEGWHKKPERFIINPLHHWMDHTTTDRSKPVERADKVRALIRTHLS